jgi:hypothetical protein
VSRLACGLFDAFTARRRNDRAIVSGRRIYTKFCLIDSAGSFYRHDASTMENFAGPRRSNFNGVTRAFVTK